MAESISVGFAGKHVVIRFNFRMDYTLSVCMLRCEPQTDPDDSMVMLRGDDFGVSLYQKGVGGIEINEHYKGFMDHKAMWELIEMLALVHKKSHLEYAAWLDMLDNERDQ
jgi:hypothetical protein